MTLTQENHRASYTPSTVAQLRHSSHGSTEDDYLNQETVPHSVIKYRSTSSTFINPSSAPDRFDKKASLRSRLGRAEFRISSFASQRWQGNRYTEIKIPKVATGGQALKPQQRRYQLSSRLKFFFSIPWLPLLPRGHRRRLMQEPLEPN